MIKRVIMKEREQYLVSTQDIREDAKRILDQARDLLTVDYNSIPAVLAPMLADFQKNSPKPEQPNIQMQLELGQTLFFDAVNFCFKDPATMHEYTFTTGGREYKRSSGLFMAIKESGIDWNNLDHVATIGKNKWRQISQIGSANPMYLGDERGERISGLAKKMLADGYKTVSGFTASTNGDGMEMLTYLANSRFFDDEFLKRAQLTVRMFNDVFRKHGAPEFKNMDQLTAMADYRLPQVFYNLRVVKLSGGLIMKLLNQEPINANSREERAIRATVVTVAEKVSKVMGINECDIDTLLWNLSQKMAKEEKLPIPHMLVTTDKY